MKKGLSLFARLADFIKRSPQLLSPNCPGPSTQPAARSQVLIGFELLHSKFRADLPAIQMWPVPEEDFDPKRHFSKLKKAGPEATGTWAKGRGSKRARGRLQRWCLEELGFGRA